MSENKLRETRFVFLDCQTTGMHPSSGELLEIAWTVTSAQHTEAEIHSRLVQPSRPIPYKIQQITGINDRDLQNAITPKDAYEELHKVFASLGSEGTAFIHYAQFEKPFLLDLFRHFENREELPFPIICSSQISRRLFPAIPSHNIRGTAGFFGTSIDELKRASSHVRATILIWKELVRSLEEKNIVNVSELTKWVQETKVKKSVPYEYRMDRNIRLALPDKPGIYRMLSKEGKILYVGKATSLKSRVNSYFRGQKGRDKKKLEMLAQVWDIQITECSTALEAAVMETDEIKRLNPPYNISLISNRHPPVFYDHELTELSTQQNDRFSKGPFRIGGAIEQLRLLARFTKLEKAPQVFHIEIEEETLLEGQKIFLEKFHLSREVLMSPRRVLAFGMQRLRSQMKVDLLVENSVEQGNAIEEDVLLEEDETITVEDVVDKFLRLAVRAATEYHRAGLLTKLLNSKISWHTKEGWSFLEVTQGSIHSTDQKSDSSKVPHFPWQNLQLPDYDRMSVLLSELSKYEHSIEAKV